MISFEFTLTDDEGENLMDLVSEAIVHAQEQTREESLPEATRQWWKGRAQYLETLRSKMHNRRVA